MSVINLLTVIASTQNQKKTKERKNVEQMNLKIMATGPQIFERIKKPPINKNNFATNVLLKSV